MLFKGVHWKGVAVAICGLADMFRASYMQALQAGVMFNHLEMPTALIKMCANIIKQGWTVSMLFSGKSTWLVCPMMRTFTGISVGHPPPHPAMAGLSFPSATVSSDQVTGGRQGKPCLCSWPEAPVMTMPYGDQAHRIQISMHLGWNRPGLRVLQRSMMPPLVQHLNKKRHGQVGICFPLPCNPCCLLPQFLP
jgi:hypothetical protein